MPFGDPGKEQFRRLIPTCRNHHIAAIIAPVMRLREELVHSEDMADRGGLDNDSRDHYLGLLIDADKWRRRLTYNPDKLPLGDKIARAIDAAATIEDATSPFGGDDIQDGATGLYDLPWCFDGTDPNIPLNSALNMSGAGLILLGAIDQAVVAITRLNSRERSHFITQQDSMRVYGAFQQIYAYLMTFAGDANRVDVAQVLASDEPLGAENAPNRKTETTGTAK